MFGKGPTQIIAPLGKSGVSFLNCDQDRAMLI
jgi:hypothetical protein